MSRTGSPSPFNAAATRVPNNGILITVNEKVSAQLSRDGSISSSEVKGDLQLRINQTELANAKILLKIAGDKNNSKPILMSIVTYFNWKVILVSKINRKLSI